LGVKGIRTNMTVVKGLAKLLYRFQNIQNIQKYFLIILKSAHATIGVGVS
jgi:hypothetical protein